MYEVCVMYEVYDLYELSRVMYEVYVMYELSQVSCIKPHTSCIKPHTITGMPYMTFCKAYTFCQVFI